MYVIWNRTPAGTDYLEAVSLDNKDIKVTRDLRYALLVKDPQGLIDQLDPELRKKCDFGFTRVEPTCRDFDETDEEKFPNSIWFGPSDPPVIRETDDWTAIGDGSEIKIYCRVDDGAETILMVFHHHHHLPKKLVSFLLNQLPETSGPRFFGVLGFHNAGPV